MNIPAQKRKQLKKNNVSNLFSTWAIYFFIIVMMITLSPYTFEYNAKNEFSWVIKTFDMFENLFLLCPLGIFLTLSNNKVNAINIIKYIALGFILSSFIEYSQLFLDNRVSQYWDIIANTLSMILGVIIGLILNPLIKKLIRMRSSMIKLSSTLFAISILIILRLMMNSQTFGLFEFSLLLCASGLLILMFNHYSLKNNNIMADISAITAIAFIFISLFPLLLTNITLFLILSLFFVLTVPTSVFLMFKPYIISQRYKKRIIFILTFLPVMFFSLIAVKNLLVIDIGFSIFQSDRSYSTSDGRGVGGVVVQAFLLFIITTQLFNHIYSFEKKQS
jgi:glycopeptide antibiotics resistance protein